MKEQCTWLMKRPSAIGIGRLGLRFWIFSWEPISNRNYTLRGSCLFYNWTFSFTSYSAAAAVSLSFLFFSFISILFWRYSVVFSEFREKGDNGDQPLPFLFFLCISCFSFAAICATRIDKDFRNLTFFFLMAETDLANFLIQFSFISLG